MGATGKASYLKLMIAAILGLLIAIAALLVVFRTSALEFTGKLFFISLGFTDVSLGIDEVALDKVHIMELSLGGEIQAQDITARYAVQSLLKGELDEVEIGALTVDLSNTQKGAIAEALKLVGEPEKAPAASKPISLPSIILKKGRIFSYTDGRTWGADITGTLSPKMILNGDARLAGSMATALGTVLLENLQLSVQADVAGQAAEFKIDGGVLRHGSETPDWTPLSLSGSGSLAKEMAELDLGVQTTSGQSLLQLVGRYDIAAKAGSATLNIPELAFNRQGLQPSDLTRYAVDLPPFDGVLSTVATLTIEGPAVTYDLNMEVTALALEQSGALVTAARVPLMVAGTYSMESGAQMASLSLSDMDAIVAYDEKTYQLKKLSTVLDIENFAETIDLKSIDGSAVEIAKNTPFIPLIFHASGKTVSDSEFKMEGAIFDTEKRIQVDLSAGYNQQKSDGALLLKLWPVKFGKGALPPSKISTYMKEFSKELSGTIAGEAKLARRPENGIQLVTSTVDISNAAYSKHDEKFEGLSLHVTAAQGRPGGLLNADITGKIKTVTLKEQSIAIPHFMAKFQIPLDATGTANAARMTLDTLQIKPLDGAIFKEALMAAGSATLVNERVNFSAALSSDFLGRFAKIKGLHSLKSVAGSAQIDISPLAFDKGALQPSDIVTIVDPALILAGEIKSEATMNWSPKGLTGKARINLANISIKTDSGEITNLSGAIDIDELFPLTISSPQQLSAARAVAGIALQQPNLSFRVLTKNGSPVLYIDRMTVGVVGGSTFIDRAVIDSGAAVNRVTVQLTSLDLEEVMALGSVEELSATGSVSGQIPLIFGGDRLLVNAGVLKADGPGVLKMKSEAARQALAGGGDQAKLLLDILENFQYSELSIKITKTESGEDTVSLHAAGSNPDIENKRPVILNINLTTSLDKIFNAVLDGYLLSEKALRATVEGRRK
ncbi:MAG: YdbH domain-containing protein [Sneathiella sp.]|nr:YdbH domain-containing protein [Sneathiella sp.]